MKVCICADVSDRDIRSFLENGKTIQQSFKELHVGRQCNKCHECVKELKNSGCRPSK
jgi:bacterioferritin-associated ferredoxin